MQPPLAPLAVALVVFAAAQSGCVVEPATEAGVSHLMSVPVDEEAGFGGVETWEVYSTEDDAGFEIVTRGTDAWGTVEAEFVLRASPDGTAELGVVMPDESGSIVLDANGQILSATLLPTPAVEALLGAVARAFETEPQPLPCEACSGVIRSPNWLVWSTVGACAVSAGSTLVILGTGGTAGLPLGGIAIATGDACIVGVASVVAYQFGFRDGQGASANVQSNGGPTAPGEWRRHAAPLSSPHPYAREGATATVDCPWEADFIRVQFAWIELARQDYITLTSKYDGVSESRLVQTRGRWLSEAHRGTRLDIDLYAAGLGGNAYGFDIEAVDCFFEE